MRILNADLRQFGPLDISNPVSFSKQLNVFVGKNGSGKTFFLRSLSSHSHNGPNILSANYLSQEIQNNVKQSSNPYLFHTKEVEIGSDRISFTATALMKEQGNQTPYLTIEFSPDKYFAQNRSEETPYSVRFIESIRNNQVNSAGYNPVMKGLEALGSRNYGDDMTSAIVTNIYKLVTDEFAKIQQEKGDIFNELRERINNILVDFDKTIEIDLTRQGEFIFCKDERGNEYSINSLSDGEKEYLNLTFKLKVLEQEPADQFVLFIDEPEVHLHSSQAYKIAESIGNIAEKNQVFVATHSTEIIETLSAYPDASFFKFYKGTIQPVEKLTEFTGMIKELGVNFAPNFLTGPFLLIEDSNNSHLTGDSSITSRELFGKFLPEDIKNKIFIQAVGSAPDNSFITSIIDDLLNHTAIKGAARKLAVLDRDKLLSRSLDDNSNLGDYIKSQAVRGIHYLPCYEIENLILQPQILDAAGITNSWETIAKSRDELEKSIAKTYVRQKLSSIYGLIKGNSAELTSVLTEAQNTLSKVDVGEVESKVKSYLDETIKTQDWAKLPGKETLKLLTKTNSDFWKRIGDKDLLPLTEQIVTDFFSEIASQIDK